MRANIQLGEITVDVVRKDIKNVHLSVHPPTGKVRIAAPSHTSLDTIRVFAISKLQWIRQQQRKLQDQERETPREYIDRESHYLPAYSPDLNPIEMAFSKLKALIRQAAARSFDQLLQATANALNTFTPQQCLNFLRHAHYATT